MGYFSQPEMQDLFEASERYKKQLDIPNANRPLDPDKLKFEEFSSILEGKGWKRGDLNVDEHVINYIYSDPKRHDFIDMLDEEIPQELIPAPDYEGIPGFGVAGGFIKTELATNAFAIAPGVLTGTIASIETGVGLSGDTAYFDWTELARYMWEDSWDASSLLAKANILLENGAKQRHEDDIAEVIKVPGIPGKVSTSGSLLTMAENYFALHTQRVFEKSQKNAKNRARWAYISDISNRAFGELEEGQERLGAAEWTDYIVNGIMSTASGTAAGIGAFVITKGDPVTKATSAMRAAQITAFAMEGMDEWQQGFEYYISQGYSPRMASKLTYGNAAAYAVGASLIERVSFGSQLSFARKYKIKHKFWNSLVEKTSANVGKAITKTPKILVHTTKGLNKMIVGAATEGVEELFQNAYQSFVQASYTGELKFDELQMSGETGATAGAFINLLMPGKKRGKTGTPSIPVTETDRDKVLISKALDIGSRYITQNELDGVNIVEDMKSPVEVINAVKRKGSKILEDLKISKEEFIDSFKVSFGEDSKLNSELVNALDGKSSAKDDQAQQPAAPDTQTKPTPTEDKSAPKTFMSQEEMDKMLGINKEPSETVDYNAYTIAELLSESVLNRKKKKGDTKASLVKEAQIKAEESQPVPGQANQFGETLTSDSDNQQSPGTSNQFGETLTSDDEQGTAPSQQAPAPKPQVTIATKQATITGKMGKNKGKVFTVKVDENNNILSLPPDAPQELLGKKLTSKQVVNNFAIQKPKEAPATETQVEASAKNIIKQSDNTKEVIDNALKAINVSGKSREEQNNDLVQFAKDNNIYEELKNEIPRNSLEFGQELNLLKNQKIVAITLSTKLGRESMDIVDQAIVAGDPSIIENAPIDREWALEVLKRKSPDGKYRVKGGTKEQAQELLDKMTKEAPADKPMTRVEAIDARLQLSPAYQSLVKKAKAVKNKLAKAKKALSKLQKKEDDGSFIPTEPSKALQAAIDKVEAAEYELGLTNTDMNAIENAMKISIPVQEEGFDYRVSLIDDQLNRDFQDIAAGNLPMSKDNQAWADRVKAKLRKDFPRIAGKEVDSIIDALSGEEKAGVAFNMIAQWAKDKSTVDTAPHEYFHILIKALSDHPLIQKALQDFGSEENLTQYVGEYYANALKDFPNTLKSQIKTFLRKFWANVKKIFGRPSQYIAEKFVEGDMLFQDAEKAALKDYKLRGQKMVNEASMEINKLKQQYGDDILQRHPTDPDRIGTIIIPESERGKGIGRKLFDAIKKEFIGKGKSLIKIEVNPGSEGFWTKMGFEKTGQIERKSIGLVDTMEYMIPIEEMTLGPLDFQQISTETEAGKRAVRLLDNAINSMQRILGKKFVLKDYVSDMAVKIPFEFATIFDFWANKHLDFKRVVSGLAINDVYANSEEYSEAFDEVSVALESDLTDISPNDRAMNAKNGVAVEYAFLHAIGGNIRQEDIIRLISAAQQYAKDPAFSPIEAFDNWANVAFKQATGLEYKNINNATTKRRIKQLYVRANSTVRVNLSSALKPRHINLEYHLNRGKIQQKSNENSFTDKTNPTTTQNMIFQATGIDITSWGKNVPALLNLSDIYKTVRAGKYQKTEKNIAVLTVNQIKEIAKKALHMKVETLDGLISGFSLVSVRGDSGHFILAPIFNEHLEHTYKPKKLAEYWNTHYNSGAITKDEYMQYMGYEKQQDGTWNRTKQSFSNTWLAGEIARYEMMTRMMPASMIKKGSEFFRRIKILTTPVFTSPMMSDFKAVQIAKNDAEQDEIYFVDKAGNEGKMRRAIAGMGQTNTTDGASIISKAFADKMINAFGADPLKRLFKTVIWKPDLSLAVKHEMFEVEPGMQIIRKKANGERIVIATVDDVGVMKNSEGKEIDMVMTNDEAKHSTYDTNSIIDIKGNELGLIKYHESKQGTAKFPLQWLNYIHDPKVLSELRKFILPRINKSLDRIFSITSSDTFTPNLLYKFIQSVRSDSPYAFSDSLQDKASIGLGLHSDAKNPLNVLMRTQILTPALSLADGEGAYLDLAPDYFETHSDSEISLAISDAKAVYKAYVAKEGGTIEDAKGIGMSAMNKWLESNPIKVLVSRSPSPYIGGALVLKVKALHERGGQAIISANNVSKRLEADHDGDAIQVEFLPDSLIDAIEVHLDNSSSRMGAIGLTPSDTDVDDLSKINNVYSLASMFQSGQAAIAQIANLQQVLGQLINSFNSIETPNGFIRIHKLEDQIAFPEYGETMSVEKQMRIWLQAAADNGKFLLLDAWDYNRDDLIPRLFYLSDEDGNNIGKLDEQSENIVKTLFNQHYAPNQIIRGSNNLGSYSIKTILKASNNHLAYTDNRAGTLSSMFAKDINLYGIVGRISFNDELAISEEIATAFARQWYGDEKKGIEARIEAGKLTPVEFEENVYKAVHLMTLRDMSESIDKDMQEVIELEELMQETELTEDYLEQARKNGMDYANMMWNSKGKGENKVGEGFASILQNMGEETGTTAWDHNPDLLRFTEYWSEAFDVMTPLEQFIATQEFLRGFAQLDTVDKLMWTNNRNVLPPISESSNSTVLNADVMSQYFKIYNNYLSSEQRLSNPKFVQQSSWSSILKRNCK